MQKHIFTIPVLAMVLLSLVQAQQLCAQNPGVMTSSGNINGQSYETIIHISDITNAPVWLTNQDDPPLAVRSAVRLAQKTLAASLGDISEWRSGNITLMDFSHGHWLYQVPFSGPTYLSPDKSATEESDVTVFVTMSGKVFGPELWPKK